MTTRTSTTLRHLAPVAAFAVSCATHADLHAAFLNALAFAVTILVGGYILTKHTTRRAQSAAARRDAASFERCMDRIARYAGTGESTYARDFDFAA